jgi:hypothetical protein
LLANEYDIAEMQVAMALAHKALRVALLEMLPAVSIFILGGLTQRRYPDSVLAIPQQDLQFIEDLKRSGMDDGSRTK